MYSIVCALTSERVRQDEIERDEEWMPAVGRGKGRGKGMVRKRNSTGDQEESSSSGSPHRPIEQGRGVSKRQGRGRGKGRGQGRGRQERQSREGIETIQSRQERMKTIVQHLSEENAKELLTKAITFHPGLMFDIIEPMTPQPGGHHPMEGSDKPKWCTCTQCREMPTEVQRVCCGKARERCISILPDFSILILDEAVLALARLYRNDVLVLNEEVDVMKANRHQGYRQFILLQHGRLGAGNRRVIPSCCLWRIRDRYPDPFGQYKGFVPGRIA